MNDVNMCQGSKCINELMKNNPYVAASDIAISRKVALFLTSLCVISLT